MSNLKIVAIIFMATIGCNTQSERQATHYRPVPEASDSIVSYLKDSIIVNDGGNNSNLRVNITDALSSSNFNASVYIANESKLILYNTTSRHVIQTINLAAQLNYEKADIFVDTDYSIYAIKWMQHEILKLDTSGALKDKFTYPATDKARGFQVYLHPAFSTFRLNKNRDFIFYSIPTVNVSDSNGQQALLNNRPIKVFSLDKNKVIVKAEGGFFPDSYKHENYYDFDIKYTIIDDSTIAYVFKVFPQIVIENIYTGKLDRKSISGLDTNASEKFLNKNNDFTYSKAYVIKNDDYNGFVYDKKKKRYYLFRNIGIPTSYSDGSLALYEDKPVVLYVIDGSTFKVIRKIYCGLGGKYWYYKPFIENSRLFLTRRVDDKKGAPVKIDIYEIP